MKRLLAIFAFGLCAMAMHGQDPQFRQLSKKARPGIDYPLKVHISASQIRQRCTTFGSNISCEELLYADAVVDGRKLELTGSKIDVIDKMGLLVPGEYRVRRTKDQHNPDSTVIYQEYELVLPDKTLWHCTLTRISE
jgi:hypothetical protein